MFANMSLGKRLTVSFTLVIALMAVLASLAYVRINDPKCVNKTFPGYFETFAGITAPAWAAIAAPGPSRVSSSGISSPAQKISWPPNRMTA